jgi:beta-lactamase regulating signal transducer with metallopeptidase domain
METVMAGFDVAFALELALKATVILGLAGLVTALIPRASAATRHLVWTLAVLCLGALPFLSLLLPAWQVPVAVGVSRFAADEALHVADANAWPAARVEVQPVAPTLPARSAVPGPEVEVARAMSSPARWGRVDAVVLLIFGWAGGAAFLLLRLVLGWVGVRRLAREAEPVSGEEWLSLAKDAAWLLDLDQPVRLLRSSHVKMPMTWGTLRPVVLLPVEAVDWSAERRRVVLLHELAHVVRRDCLTQTLADLACAFYWVHPLTWVAARRLRAERERACDDRVLAAGERAPAYAGHLLEVARAYRAPGRAGAAAISMARPSQLEGRLLAVLDGGRRRGEPGARARAAGLATGLLLLLPLAAVRTVSATPAEAGMWDEAELPIENATGWALSDPSHDDMEVPAPPEGESMIEWGIRARSGETVRIELAAGGDLRIRGWSEDSVAVRAHLSGSAVGNTKVDLAAQRGAVVLRAVQVGEPIGRGSRSFELRVPLHSNLEIRSAGGEIGIDEVRGRLSGGTGGGPIRVRRAVGVADLSTGGGQVEIADSELDGSVTTGGGDVRIVNTRGGLQGRTGGGRVLVDGSASSQRPGANSRPLSYSTGGGDIVLGHLPNGGAASTGGGEIRIGSAGGDVRASTGGGAITIGGVAGEVVASTGSGAVTIGPVSGSARISSGNGVVELTMAAGAGPRSVQIDAENGSVTLVLPPEFSGTFDIEIGASPRNGEPRLRTDFPLSINPANAAGRIRATGRSGAGENRVRVRAEHGDVVIRRGTARQTTAALRPAPGTSFAAPPVPAAAPGPDHAHAVEAVELGIEAVVAAAVASGFRAAGEAFQGPQLADFFAEIAAEIAAEATRAGISAAARELSAEERREIEREARRSLREELAPPGSKPRP